MGFLPSHSSDNKEYATVCGLSIYQLLTLVTTAYILYQVLYEFYQHLPAAFSFFSHAACSSLAVYFFMRARSASNILTFLLVHVLNVSMMAISASGGRNRSRAVTNAKPLNMLVPIVFSHAM